MNKTTQANETNVLISKQGKSLIILILSIIIITVISGILGAFESGKFYKTFDFVEVNVPYEEVDKTDPIFKDYDKNSREIIRWEKEYIYNETTQETIETKVKMYKGYYTKFFFESRWFYSDALTNSVIVLLFYISLVGYLLPKRLEENDVYKMLENELNEMILVENALPAISFEPFMERWNKERKIRQHTSNVKYKLAKLEQQTKYQIRKTFYIKDKEGNLVFHEPDKELTWKEKGYLNKKETLESYLTKEYIENHVEFKKVKHFKYIHPSFVTTGKNEIIESTDEYSAIKSDAQKSAEDYTRKAFLSVSSSFVVASILSFVLFRIADGWLVIMYNVFMRMLPLVLQIILANSYTNKTIRNHSIPTLRYRLNIANIYLVSENTKEV